MFGAAFTCSVGLGATTLPASAVTLTSLKLNSQPGDYIGQGLSKTFTPADGTFTAQKNFDNGVSIRFSGNKPGVWWDLDFAAPGNALLVPGKYLGAARYPFQSASQPGLNVSGEGRGSNKLTGQFTVLEVVYGPGTAIQSFAADFEQHSEGAAPALFGQVSFNSSATPVPFEFSPTFGLIILGNLWGAAKLRKRHRKLKLGLAQK